MGAGIIPAPQVLGYAADFAYVVEADHEHAKEQHSGNSSGPVPMVRHHAIFGAHGDHANDLQRAQISGHKRKARDPTGQGTAGQQVIFRGSHAVLEPVADAQHKEDVRHQYREIDGSEMHVESERISQIGGPCQISKRFRNWFRIVDSPCGAC